MDSASPEVEMLALEKTEQSFEPERETQVLGILEVGEPAIGSAATREAMRSNSEQHDNEEDDRRPHAAAFQGAS